MEDLKCCGCGAPQEDGLRFCPSCGAAYRTVGFGTDPSSGPEPQQAAEDKGHGHPHVVADSPTTERSPWAFPPAGAWSDDTVPAWQSFTPLILENFQWWHRRYPSALLLRSSDYSSQLPGYWVIVVGHPYQSGQAVVSWCQGQGLNNDNCDATALSNTLPSGPQTYKSW